MRPAVVGLANDVLARMGGRFVPDRPAPVDRTAVVPVSVVIPAYNRAVSLAATIASVQAQRPKPDEIIVVDDASTDDTREVAASLGADVVVLERNSGAAVARRVGAQRARHEWVALVDSDDEWPPWTLETLWPRRNGHDFVAGSAVWLQDGELHHFEGLPAGWAFELTRPDLLAWPQNMVPASGTLVRRDRLLEVLERVQVRQAEDFATWLQLLRGGTGLLVARPTLLYNMHPDQKSHSAARHVDRHASVTAAFDGSARGHQLLRRRQRVDAFDAARSAEGLDGRRRVLWALVGPGGPWVAGAVALRRLQHRRSRRLTDAWDLAPERWTTG